MRRQVSDPGPFEPLIRRRRSIRLPGYDYTQPGVYFVTICTHERRCWLGRVEDGAMVLSASGRLAERCWRDLAVHFSNVELDEFVVMPNHLHGLVTILAPDDRGYTGIPGPEPADATAVGAKHSRIGIGRGNRVRARMLRPYPDGDVGEVTSQSHRVPSHPMRGPDPARCTRPGSLGAIIQNFKAVSARNVNRLNRSPGARLWQRNYYEHVVRTEDALRRIRAYTAANPASWELDQLHPDNPPTW